MLTLSIKLAFSVVLGLAALFVILSNKYPARIQKWAIVTLGMIAVVWVGPIPSETHETLRVIFFTHAADGAAHLTGRS